tara:strand:+ start:326 stop:484 length:159 start_codon:yes stop_codon:yes gene_type:complete
LFERATIIDISKNIYIELAVEKKLPEARKGKISEIKIKITINFCMPRCIFHQ